MRTGLGTVECLRGTGEGNASALGKGRLVQVAEGGIIEAAGGKGCRPEGGVLRIAAVRKQDMPPPVFGRAEIVKAKVWQFLGMIAEAVDFQIPLRIENGLLFSS